jgi:hypothetical protein
MKNILRFVLLTTAFFSTTLSYSQPGCPAVNAGSDVVLGCGQTCTTLHATAFAGATTTAYTVSPIPYNPPFPFNAGIPILVNQDDAWSDTIDLPF